MSGRKQDIQKIIAGMHAIRRKLMICGLAKSSSMKQVVAAITPSQWAVLGVILEHKKVGVKDIAENLGISSSAATQLVDGLVEKGYVIRENNKKDRRAFVLRVSSKHAKKIERMKVETIKRFTDLFRSLTNKEVAVYASLNKKIVDGIFLK